MNAREQLKKNGQFDKQLAALAGQAISPNLRRRQKDFHEMMDNPLNLIKNMAGYHKPGSQKK